MAAVDDEPAGLYEHRHPPRTLSEPRRRRWGTGRGVLLPVISVLVVAAVVAVAVLTGYHKAGTSSATGTQPRSLTLIYRVEPTPVRSEVTRSALERTVSIIRSRARELGVSRVQIHTRGTNEIVVKLDGIHNPPAGQSFAG